jgi:photosystem II stability/assembly factor-like uncharacterized protein
MTRPTFAVRISAALAAGGVVLLLGAAGPGAAVAVAHHVPGPGELVVPAGTRLGIESEPDAALPDSTVADLDAAANQHLYAQQAAALPVAKGSLPWKNVGPFGQDDPADYPTGGLRFARSAGMGATIEPDPRDATGSSVYVGNMGGLWHTADAGKTWHNLSDGKLTRAAVGAIAVDPENPNDLYVGTGIAYLTTSGDAPGSGIWVSHDAGTTFTRPAANIKGYAVNDILVTRDGVLAGTTNGLYRSTNHGASFQRVPLPNNAAHTAPATGAYATWISSIVASPINDKQIIAAVGLGLGKRIGKDGKPQTADGQPLSPGNGLYKTAAGVAGTFTFMASTSQLKHSASSVDPVGRIMLSWVKAASGDTTVLWAIVNDAGLASGRQPAGSDADLVAGTTGQSLNATGTQFNGLYRSPDGGLNWTVKATPQSLSASVNEGLGIYPALGYGVGVQAYYNLWVQGDPRNPNAVYFGLEEVFQSVKPTDDSPALGQFEIVQRYWDVCGSTTYFENVYPGQSCPDQTPYYGSVSTHPDQHFGVLVDTGSALRMYTANDGGFFWEDSHPLTPSMENGYDNKSWHEMNTLPTVQPYKIARKPDGEYIHALQDNGAGFVAPGQTATLVSSGDGVNVLATPDKDTWYMTAQGAIPWVTTDHGKHIRAFPADLVKPTFLSPMGIDPTDPNHLAIAGEDIHETTKGPNTSSTIDPLLYTVIQTDWTQSFDAKNSPVEYPKGTKVAYQSQALAIRGTAVYDAICGLCRNALGDPALVTATVATNVKPGCVAKKAATDCWHIAAGAGLPHNSIWNLAIDPTDVDTIYVALNNNSLVGFDPKVGGTQRVMVSHDAGEHFTDITGNLPRSQARDVVVRGDQLVVATDNGVFTAPKTGKAWSRLGGTLPQVRVNDLDLDPTGRYLSAAVFGRGIWVLDYGAKAPSSSGPGPKGEPTVPKTEGRGIPATGVNAGLGVIALLLLGVAAVTRRAGRAAA